MLTHRALTLTNAASKRTQEHFSCTLHDRRLGHDMDQRMNRTIFFFATLLVSAAALADSGSKWVATWSTSPQGPYPIGYTVGQPLLNYAFRGRTAN